ncbi:hypothetical protein SDJN02_17238 [Cucurbita argyrosperma subsp. argyrosperma]|nr:hypothetical protein SDJN02_17238 [Cucurbita argyrosperma subsp. argyrosperma]
MNKVHFSFTMAHKSNYISGNLLRIFLRCMRVRIKYARMTPICLWNNLHHS